MVNVTTVQPNGSGYLTAYPCTGSVPVASFSNFSAGRDVANTTTAKLDANGGFCLFSSATTHLVVDLYGTLGAAGDGFVPTDPVRIYDSRSTGSAITRPIAIATGSNSLHGNVTVSNGTVGYATVWPGTGDGTCPARPNTSLVNWSDDAAVANRIDISLPFGELCVTTSTPAHVIVDSYGRYDASGTKVDVEVPARLFDSRSTRPGTSFAIATHSDRATLTVNMVSIGGVAGYTTIWSSPSCDVAPVASLTNQGADGPKANSIQLRNEGQLCVIASSKIDLIIDLD